MNNNKVYCITHGAWANSSNLWFLGDECLWVTCPPPEVPDNWIDFVVEPSPDEMERINLNARELEMSL